MVNSFLNVGMKTSFLWGYVPDDILGDDTPDGDNGINDNNDDQNYKYDNNDNNDSNYLNDNNNDDNDNNYDDDNDDQTTMIFQVMHFEPSICEKAEFLAFNYIPVHKEIVICLHSVEPLFYF